MIARLVAFIVGPEFIRWLGRFAEDGSSGNPSTKRFAALIATSVYALLAIYLGWRLGQVSDTDAMLLAYGITAVCMMILAGFAYLVGKVIERMNPPSKGGPPDGRGE